MKNKIIFKNNLNLFFGLLICGAVFLLTIIAPLLVNIDTSPSLEMHLTSWKEGGRLGYGELGIDVLSWLILGTRQSLFIAFIICFFSCLLGCFIGAISGYFGGFIDSFLMRITDVVLAFPGILLALYLASILPPSNLSLCIALTATAWVGYARIIRSRVLELKNADFVLAGKALGKRDYSILLKDILPNCSNVVLIHFSYSLSGIILAESGLTFLGVGLPIGTPSLGALLDMGVNNIFSHWYLSIIPGAAIFLIVIGFNLLGDGLVMALNPKKYIKYL